MGCVHCCAVSHELWRQEPSLGIGQFQKLGKQGDGQSPQHVRTWLWELRHTAINFNQTNSCFSNASKREQMEEVFNSKERRVSETGMSNYKQMGGSYHAVGHAKTHLSEEYTWNIFVCIHIMITKALKRCPYWLYESWLAFQILWNVNISFVQEHQQKQLIWINVVGTSCRECGWAQSSVCLPDSCISSFCITDCLFTAPCKIKFNQNEN